jgi:hypothetical protein
LCRGISGQPSPAGRIPRCATVKLAAMSKTSACPRAHAHMGGHGRRLRPAQCSPPRTLLPLVQVKPSRDSARAAAFAPPLLNCAAEPRLAPTCRRREPQHTDAHVSAEPSNARQSLFGRLDLEHHPALACSPSCPLFPWRCYVVTRLAAVAKPPNFARAQPN